MELDIRGIPGLRPGEGDIRRVRLLLARAELPPRTREGIWARILDYRTSDAWVVAATGLMMPALRHIAGSFAAAYAGEPADLDGEVLVGFLTGLSRATPSDGSLAARLACAGYLSGLATTRLRMRPGVDLPVFAAIPPPPWAIPRMLIDTAYRLGVVSQPEAGMLYATRLGGVALAQVATHLGLAAEELAVRRARVEERLTQLLLAGRITVWENR
jgi:hypothetical protein